MQVIWGGALRTEHGSSRAGITFPGRKSPAYRPALALSLLDLAYRAAPLGGGEPLSAAGFGRE